jgi:dihydroflavonol-4-reductase
MPGLGPTLVTGGTGFIGSAVVRRLLARGRAVRVLVEPGAPTANLDGLDVERVEGSILDAAAVGRAVDGCDAVHHLAAIYTLWMRDDRPIYDVNVEGAKNVLHAARRAGARRIVHTSSIAALGLPADGQLADEDTPFNYWKDANAYMRSKFQAHQDARRLAADGAPVVIVCPAFPFGARDIGPTPTGGFIVETLRRRVPGTTTGGFCAVDVDDVAECQVLAEEKAAVGSVTIAGAHNVTHHEFFNAVARVAGLPPIKRRIPTPAVLAFAWAMETAADLTGKPPRATVKAARYTCRAVWFDCRRARALGMPVTPLDESIEKAVRWFRDHGYDRAAR